MRELDRIRRLAPPVEPLTADAVARVRTRALAPRRRRVPVAVLIAPVAVAAAAAFFVVLGGGAPDRERPALAPQAVAEAGAPRLLLPGWSVMRADEWAPDHGEMTFERDGRELELSWMPADDAGGLGGKPGMRAAGRAEVAGAEAALWRYAGDDDYVAVWRDGPLTVSARGPAANPADFAAVVGGLERAGDAAWRSALPRRAVTPAIRPRRSRR